MILRVLQVLGRSAGGIARHVATLTAALDGGDGLVVDIAGPSDLPVPMPKPVASVAIPDGPFGHRRAIARLRRLISQGGYDVVHAHGLRAGIDASVAARGSGASLVVTVHNLVRPEVSGRAKALLYKPAERIVIGRADVILAVSRDIASQLEKHRSEDSDVRIEVLHLGVDAPRAPARTRDEVRSELQIGDDEALVVTASRLSGQKSLHVMLDAMVEVPGVLAILGTGPLEADLRDRARSMGIADRVSFLGFRNDVTDFIAAADVFCLSSVWEGVPLAAMEAAGLGTPIVATAVGGTPELVEDGVSGRLVTANDPGALAEALRDVIADPLVAEMYAAGAKQKLAEDFGIDQMVARVRDIYRELSR